MAESQTSTTVISSDERPTPRWLVDSLSDSVGGFDLDPASGAESEPIAPTRYTREDDGLSKDWFGNVWLNPPYSDPEPWLAKAREEVENGNADSVSVLVKGDTSTGWYQKHGLEADYVLYLNQRLKFGKEHNAPFPSHLLIFEGAKTDGLVDMLAKASDFGKMRIF